MAGVFSKGKTLAVCIHVLWVAGLTCLCQAAATRNTSDQQIVTPMGNSTDSSNNNNNSSTANPIPSRATLALPLNWDPFCVKSENFVKWNFSSLSSDEVRHMTQISCRLQHGEKLFFSDFRDWMSTAHVDVKVAVKVVCDDSSKGSFHLPWPMKVKHLVYAEVHGCDMPDYYSEYFNNNVTLIPDQLRVLDLKNCRLPINVTDLYHLMTNIKNSSKDVECGPLTLEKFTFSNVSFDILLPDYSDYAEYGDYEDYEYGNDINEMENMDGFWNDYRRLSHECDFKNLRYSDESYFIDMSGRHLYSLDAKAFYPELQFYNLSHIGFDAIPMQFQEWRRHMEKMSFLDLSHNVITEVDFTDSGDPTKDSIGTINLQYNSIRQLRKSDLDTLLRMETATIDIRNNFLNCSCGMLMDFHEFLKRQDLGRYEYLRDLRCGWPEKFAGRRASDLTKIQVECKEGIIALLGALAGLLIVIVVGVIFFFRYRREVIIIVYTRFHILLPCQTTIDQDDKEYDAFISYSSKDDEWVLKSLVKTLETNEQSSKAFKLCVHHRDFEIGAAIADNIVRSVESSRHTIMVVSRNYIQSEWCIYEFRTAMQQSLIERRKHLIIVLLEDVPRSELESDLRKWLDTTTYIQAGDNLFWDKLRYTLEVRNKSKSPRRLPAPITHPSEKDCLKAVKNNNIV